MPEKMKWKRVSQEMVASFEKIVPKDEHVERRKMFGCPCAFVGGNMFMGVHQDNMFLRLPEAGREEFFKIKGAVSFEPMPGRFMKEYVVVPRELLGDTKSLKGWIRRSIEYALSLPAKKSKSKK